MGFLIRCSSLFLFFSVQSKADLLYVAKKSMISGYGVFDLYDDPARLRECVGLKKVMSWLEKDGKRYPYGEGCWLMQGDGWMIFAIDAGGRQLYQSRIHRTELQWQVVTPNSAK